MPTSLQVVEGSGATVLKATLKNWDLPSRPGEPGRQSGMASGSSPARTGWADPRSGGPVRLTSCDGPDCTNMAADSTGDEDEPPDQWLHVDAYDDLDCGDYCSWQCLANIAMSHALD